MAGCGVLSPPCELARRQKIQQSAGVGSAESIGRHQQLCSTAAQRSERWQRYYYQQRATSGEKEKVNNTLKNRKVMTMLQRSAAQLSEHCRDCLELAARGRSIQKMEGTMNWRWRWCWLQTTGYGHDDDKKSTVNSRCQGKTINNM